MYIVKRFSSTTDLWRFLNFDGQTKVEGGLATISGSDTITATSGTTYSDWTDYNGNGDDIFTLGSLNIIINGDATSEPLHATGLAAQVIKTSSGNLGALNGSSVPFEIYLTTIPSFDSTKIVSLTQDSNNNWTLVYEATGKTFTVPTPS
tara:strand:- start:2209 stop:2655 length:447 start_codon:yes stop_codon:yes gene_type:complete